ENLVKRRTGEKGLGFGANVTSKDNRGVGELLALIEPQDLIKFGMIPEFVGRLPMLATLEDLTEDDLVTILTQPKNALVKQYQKLFEMERVKLTFTKEALRAIAHEAMRRKAGARALRARRNPATAATSSGRATTPGARPTSKAPTSPASRQACLRTRPRPTAPPSTPAAAIPARPTATWAARRRATPRSNTRRRATP